MEVDDEIIKKFQPKYYPRECQLTCVGIGEGKQFFPFDIRLLSQTNRIEFGNEIRSYDLSYKKDSQNNDIGEISVFDYESTPYAVNGYKTEVLEPGEIVYVDFFRRSEDDTFATYRKLESFTPYKVQLFGFGNWKK